MKTSNRPVEEISIQLDADAVRAYKSASTDEKKKIQILISNWLKEFAQKDKPSLKQFMDETSDNVQIRGLTPEILESILSDEK
jgi:hypothetical protein